MEFEPVRRAVPLTAGLCLIVVIAMQRPLQRAHEASMPNEPVSRSLESAW
ncbi:MAG: hypothetical protein Q8S33_31100 [Myxococcales bacterium]|nr:hypothetical protein [Myxococcales bacterium]